MITYFVHDSRKGTDLFVLPEAGRSVAVSAEKFQEFISPRPEFSSWEGTACPGLEPEHFGQVVATRDENGDVCVLDAGLWQQRMTRYLG